MLSDQELFRYSRQLLLEEFGIDGQETLKNSRILVVGLGGLGSVVSLYLAGAGVGTLVLADGDRVDATNLHRQILYRELDIGRNKAMVARDNLSLLNSKVKYHSVEKKIDWSNLLDVLENIDVVVDATDNYTARFDLNEACLNRGVPIVSAAAERFEGQVTIIHPALGGPCYRCLYPDSNQSEALSCSESGIMPPVLGVLGSVQAFEVIRFLCNFEHALLETVLFVDLMKLDFKRVKYLAKKDCPDCSHLYN